MNDLTQGPVSKHLIKMSLFMAVSMTVQVLYFIADLYWTGRLGKEAIAAVSLAGNQMFIVMALTQTLGVGTTTLISHAVGQKDKQRANTVFNQSMVLGFFVTVLVGVVGFATLDSYCRSLGADAGT